MSKRDVLPSITGYDPLCPRIPISRKVSYLFGSPFSICISHILRRLNGWYIFQNAIAESNNCDDGTSNYSYNRLVKQYCSDEDVD